MATNVTREPSQQAPGANVPGEGGASQWKRRRECATAAVLRYLVFLVGVPDYGIGHSILETSCKQSKRLSKFVNYSLNKYEHD